MKNISVESASVPVDLHTGESLPASVVGEISMTMTMFCKPMTFCKPMMQAAVLAVCTTALCAVPMIAQDNPAPQQQDQAGPQGGRQGGAGREEHQIEQLTKKLNLTPDQVTQVKAIDDDSRQQMMALRSDSSVAQSDKHAKMMAIHQASQDKIRAVLNDDQKTKFDAMQAEMKARRESRGGGQGGAPPPPPQQ
jgi:periplasmic protein CpxP/Spy